MPTSNVAIRRRSTLKKTQAGYTLLMVIFLVASSLILSAAIVPNVLTQGRREREAEMIWRGEQYKRAIGLYFRKFGKYPTKVDDLVKQTNGVRFLRQAYTDPMNKEDGTWRFIYVGPNGQLIGSVHSQSLLQSMMQGPGGAGASSLLGGAGQSSPFGGTSSTSANPQSGFGASGTTQSTAQTSQTNGQPGQPGQPSTSALAPDPLESQPQPLEGTIVGGNIIGVGSKIKTPSLLVYDGGDTYEKWEFIWNPVQTVAIPGQANPLGPVAPPAAPTQQPQPDQQQLQQQQQQLQNQQPPSVNPAAGQPSTGATLP
jgi:type II secretory pathway pseudopilin PulG